jgi:RNA-directed DNA polymerase
VNTGAPWPSLIEAHARVHAMQAKLHHWAVSEPDRCFTDLGNLVHDPAFLVVAWHRVRANKGARSAAVDGVTPRSLGEHATEFLAALRSDLKARRFRPDRVRERMIPKANGKLRRLGIPTAADRVVQGALKLVLEPIFEADFKPCSYGFRPKRRAQDAIAEIHMFASRGYTQVVDADITACFDEIDHGALMQRVRRRVGDKRILPLIKAFLKAGLLSEDGTARETITGTPQGGILSPLLANIALSVLDEHFTNAWEALGSSWKRGSHRRAGHATARLARYADDFVILVHGTHEQALALRDEASEVLAPMGLRLSQEKTRICHIDNGFDFLGWRIQRRSRRGRAGRKAIYTYPSRRALTALMKKVRSLTRRNQHKTLADLLQHINPVLRGWCTYFRHGVSARTFSYVDHFTWWRIVGWIRKRHGNPNWSTMLRRHIPNWAIRDGATEMFRPQRVAITRYRYRDARIPTPWASTDATTVTA